LGRGRAKAAPKRRPSAAKRIIRAEVPKDTGPIHLQASFFRAAAARHALVLDELAIKVVLGLHNAAKEHPAVYAGVGAIMISSGWVRWVRGRLFHVNTSCVLAAPPGSLDPPAGASYVVVNSRIIPCVY
jgi:hypothetical protein